MSKSMALQSLKIETRFVISLLSYQRREKSIKNSVTFFVVEYKNGTR